MKKRKLLITLLTLAFSAMSAFALASCDVSAVNEPTEIEKVYAQYVVYAEAEGEEPLSYEEWLATIKGEKGEKGEDGKDGVNGQDGVDGKSAYQIWLDNGHEGTEEDFLAWLKGEDGKDGVDGEDGQDGTDGVDGVGIEKVEYDNDGNLVIHFTDGTTQTVEMPEIKTETLHYQKIKGKEEYRVIGLGTVSDYKVTIPASYRGLPVTEITPDAFMDSTYLTEVVIGDSVTTIGSSAFSGCDSLTEVVIPDSVTTIGERAFNDCTSLTEINVSENNTAYKSIDGNLYTKDGTTLLQYAVGKTATSFTIPDSVTTIGYRAFVYCDSLTEVVIGDSVTTIGEYAFYYCSSLTEIVIPNSVTTIGKRAFEDCDSLTEIVIGDNVTTIGDSAFYDCDGLTEIIIPESVTTIGGWAFNWCSSLTIYCEAESKPDGWDSDWNYSNCPVVWGYTGE